MIYAQEQFQSINKTIMAKNTPTSTPHETTQGVRNGKKLNFQLKFRNSANILLPIKQQKWQEK